MAQLDLFERPQELDFSRERLLAEKLSKWVRFGTSSFTFSGWSGVVYPVGTTERELRNRGLELYQSFPLFSTVGIDSSYYRPLGSETLRRYASQLPSGFQCVSKVFSQVTTLADPRTHEPNPHFLSPTFFEREVLRPLSIHFRENLGPLVLEFPPLRHPYWLAPEEFATRLDQFFSAVSSEFKYAVEIRNRELLTAAYRDVLQRHRVSHVFNYWEQMPSLRKQWEALGDDGPDFAVARLLIPPGQRYAQKKEEFAPFNRIVEPQPQMREELVRLARRFERVRRVLFVIVNNKAEGCSPATVQALAKMLAEES